MNSAAVPCILLLLLACSAAALPVPKILKEGGRTTEVFSLRGEFEKADLPPKAQGGRGTCGIFAVTGALEYEWAKRDLKKHGTRLSENYLLWGTQKKEVRKRDASVLEDVIHAAKFYGMCREELFPYDPAGGAPAEPPSKAGWEAKQRAGFSEYWIKRQRSKRGISATELADMLKALRRNHPVVAHLGAWGGGDGKSWRAETTSHAVLITGYRKVSGYDDQFTIEYRDSAAADYASIPLEQLKRSLIEAMYFQY